MEEKSEVDKALVHGPTDIIKIYDAKGDVIKTLNEDEIKLFSKELLDGLLSQSRRYKDFGMMSKLLQQLIDIKKAYWPATQTNKNLNINLYDEQLEKWKEAAKELRKLEQQHPQVIEVK